MRIGAGFGSTRCRRGGVGDGAGVFVMRLRQFGMLSHLFCRPSRRFSRASFGYLLPAFFCVSEFRFGSASHAAGGAAADLNDPLNNPAAWADSGVYPRGRHRISGSWRPSLAFDSDVFRSFGSLFGSPARFLKSRTGYPVLDLRSSPNGARG